MSGEAETNISGWTTDTLKEHFQRQVDLLQERLQRQLDSLEKHLNERQESNKDAITASLASQEKAVTKAELAAEKRFESVNEFREQLRDQASLFISKDEVAVRFQSLEERILDLKVSRDLNQGKITGKSTSAADNRAIIAVVASVASVLVALVALVVVIVLAV